MKPLLAVALVAAFLLPTTSAHADDAASRCVSVAIPRGQFAQRDGGRWIDLTHAQFLFLEGVYVLNPETPAGLPYGDHAALATIPGHDGGLVFFLDGDLACAPMPIPRELIDMLGDVAADVVHHAGATN